MSVSFALYFEQTISDGCLLSNPYGTFEFVFKYKIPFKSVGHAQPIGYASPEQYPSSKSSID